MQRKSLEHPEIQSLATSSAVPATLDMLLFRPSALALRALHELQTWLYPLFACSGGLCLCCRRSADPAGCDIKFQARDQL